MDYILFERPRGIETAAIVPLGDLGLAAKNRVDYEPSPWRALTRVLLPREVMRDDVFIDFGCGKGRVLIQAAMYPFRKVIGVELSADLCAIAEDNIERSLQRLRCKNVEVINTDVLEYEFPDDVTVVYFYNPFEGEIFAAALDKLVASVRRRPRELKIIYTNPVEEELLLRAGAQLVRAMGGMRPTKKWSKQNSTRLYVLPSHARPAKDRG